MAEAEDEPAVSRTEQRTVLGVASNAAWHDLSDAELRARLSQRGCPRAVAESLVRRRDELAAARSVIAILGENR